MIHVSTYCELNVYYACGPVHRFNGNTRSGEFMYYQQGPVLLQFHILDYGVIVHIKATVSLTSHS